MTATRYHPRPGPWQVVDIYDGHVVLTRVRFVEGAYGWHVPREERQTVGLEEARSMLESDPEWPLAKRHNARELRALLWP